MSHRRIAALVATPPGVNPGMLACDLALKVFAERHGFTADLEVYRLYSIEERIRHFGKEPEQQEVLARAPDPLASTVVRHDLDALISSDVILYWGDFLHMAQYHRALKSVLTTMGVPNQPDLVARALLLAGADHATLRRAVSFGTTLLFNTLQDEQDATYGPLLRRFLRSAGRVWVRDAMSAAKTAHLRNDYRTSYLGVDCAQLLTENDIRRHADAAPDLAAGEIGVFLGRSALQMEAMLDLARALSARLKRRWQWLDWGCRQAFPALVSGRVPRFSAPALSLVRHLSECALIVTDTYHAAVLAWTFGVPAVAVAAPFVDKATNVNSGAEFAWRDKREIFFSQYDALDFLVRAEELVEPARRNARLEHIVACLEDGWRVRAITSRITQHARAAEADLAATVRGLLNGGRPSNHFTTWNSPACELS